MVTRTLAAVSLSLGLTAILVGCGSDTDADDLFDGSSGGQVTTGGAATGATPGTTGGTGASPATGGALPTGGAVPTGGTGGAVLTGGTGGAVPPGGPGGTVPTGGTGGTVPTGGTGGTVPTGGAGGTVPTGGAGGAGGTVPTGGTGGDGSGGTEPTGGTGGGEPGEPPFTLPVAVTPWQPSDACKAKAAEILAGLSTSQKVAQMIQGETLTTSPSDVSSRQLGSVFGGGSADPSNNSATAWAEMATQYQNAGLSFGIPILYGIDAVHGHNNVRDATMFPHNIGLGCTRDADLLRRVSHATAVEVRATGINWTFAPTIAAARDERWGRTFESFSEEPTLTAWMGLVASEGLQQGTNLTDPASILACAKHFAGDGNTAGGTDQGDVILDQATFRRLAVDQYQPLINAGVATVMISYSQYGTSAGDLERVTGSRELVTDLLKGEMGFAGIVVSDYNAIMKLGGSGSAYAPTAEQAAAGVNAGLDMLMMAGAAGTGANPNWLVALGLLEAAAGSSDPNTGIPMSRIDDAVTRILQVKCEMGMFEPGYGVSTNPSVVGSAEHRAIAREAVQKSLVVLENDDGILPLPVGSPVLVAGTAADSMVKQCGGWTIDWQGLGTGTGHSADADTTAGTTILGGIRAALGDGNVAFSQDGTAAAGGATAGIVVVGEPPYAELHGDEEDLSLQARSSADHTALENMLGNGLPIVLVIVSGRPLLIDSYLSNPNLKAVVAAWLPGSEGAGVADVLFGAVSPTGRLGHSWPKAGQIPINWDDADYASDPPLFPLGHGLTW